ncbi:MAG: biopolymer transporter ExbD [Alphaproteobacteria bacterium]|nr:biopolymer transporter ExbD [Alphaproteobacteria bacterium]
MVIKKTTIKGDITLTPLIDVVFILLIFFMVTMSLFNVRTIKINSPKTTSAINQNSNNDDDVKIFVIKKDYILIDKLKLNDTLQANKYIDDYMATKNDKKIIWGIKPDKTINVERYLSVWKKLSEAGNKINIVTPKKGNVK